MCITQVNLGQQVTCTSNFENIWQAHLLSEKLYYKFFALFLNAPAKALMEANVWPVQMYVLILEL